MTHFEYAAIFFGIVTAMSLENVASSFHKLFEASGRVRWHWMAPTNAVGSAIVALGQFWVWWLTRDNQMPHRTFLTFLPGATAAFILYLQCAAALPDTIPEAGINLKDWYYSTRRQFWSIATVSTLLNATLLTWGMVRMGFNPQFVRFTLPFLILVLILSAIGASMIYVRASWWHAIGIIAVTSIMLLMFGSMQL